MPGPTLAEASVLITANTKQFAQQLHQVTFAPLEASAERAGESIQSSMVEAAHQSNAALDTMGGAAVFGDITRQAEAAGEGVQRSMVEAASQSDTALDRIGGADVFGDVVRQADRAGEQVTGHFKEAARQSDNAMRGMGTRMAGGLAALGIGAAGTAIVGFGLKTAASLEMTEVGFAGLLGSSAEAKAMMESLTTFAAQTPLEMPGLSDMTKNLLAQGQQFGVTQENVLDYVGTIGDISSVLGGGQAQMDGVTRALGQMGSSSKVMGNDLMQITNNLPGFASKMQLAEGVASKYGITVEEAGKKIQDGGISGAEGAEILLSQMEKFPGAAGAMERSSQTLTGQLSTFKDEASMALAEGLKPVIGVLTDTGGLLDQLGPAVAQFGAIFGTAIATLAPAIGPLLAVIFDLVGVLVDSLVPIFEALQPVIIEVAEMLGAALGDALVQLMPLVAELLEGLLPLLPPLMELALSLLPPLLEVLLLLIPPFTDLVTIIADSLIGPIETLAGWIETLATSMSENKDQVIALAAVLGVALYSTIAPIVAGFALWAAGAIAAAAATLLAAAPWILLAVIIGGAVLLIINHWDKIKAALQWVWDLFMAVFHWVADNWPLLLAILTGPIGLAVLLITEHWETIKNAISAAVQWIWTLIQTVWNAIWQFISGVVSGISDTIGAAWQWIKDTTADLYNGVKTWFDKIASFIGGVVSTVRGYVDRIVNGFQRIGTGAMDAYNAVVSWFGKVTEFIGGLVDSVSRTVGRVVDAIKAPINGAIRALNSFHVPEFEVGKIEVAGREVFGGMTLGGWHPFNIPELAAGGIISRPTLALLGEAGPEAVVPLGRGPMPGSVTFGPGAVAVNFVGVVPTQGEAYRTGLAVGEGINDAILAQRLRLEARRVAV